MEKITESCKRESIMTIISILSLLCMALAVLVLV